MKASVIIPAFNEESGISETLKAIQAQDYPDFEVIVVDNASTDKTADVARTFTGIKVVREDNKGTSWARERGRQEAQGEIIVTMDADCLPDPNWLTKGMGHFNDMNISAVGGPYDYYDANPAFRYVSFAFQITLHRLFNWFMQTINKGASLIGGNSFMRASALEAVGGFNTSLVFYGDDTDTAKKLATKGRVLFDPDLVMSTSARRFKKEGLVKLEIEYIKHFFKVILAK